MKKILLAILMFFYLALAVRATVHLHDCIDIFTSTSTDNHPGLNDKLPCKNDPKQCELETEYKINEAALKSYRVLSEAILPVPSPSLESFYPPHNDYVLLHNNCIPAPKICLFILHRTIRI